MKSFTYYFKFFRFFKNECQLVYILSYVEFLFHLNKHFLNLYILPFFVPQDYREGKEYFIYKCIQTEYNNSFENGLRRIDSPSEYHLYTKRPRNKFEKKNFNCQNFYRKSLGLKIDK